MEIQIESGETTTGNSTGIVMNINAEKTSAALPQIGAGQTYIMNASKRYKDIYTKPYTTKIGDAIFETQGWHGSTDTISKDWIDYNEYVTIVRSYSNSVFSFSGYNGTNYQGMASYRKALVSRAVIVVGTGI